MESNPFLANNLEREIQITGEFVCFGGQGSALFQHCFVQENGTIQTISLGQMWLQNFSNKVKGTLEKGTVL